MVAGAETGTPTGEQQQQPKTRFVGSATGESMAAAVDPGAGASAAIDPDAGVDGGEPEGGAPEGDDNGGQEAGNVVGHGGKAMSQEAIAERVARARKKQLRELFGTDDEEQIKRIVARGKADGELMTPEQKKEFERLRRLEEQRKRQRMTAEQRMQAELEERDKRIQELNEQLKEREQREIVQRQDQVVTEAASAHIDPQYLKYARRDLAEHLNELKETNPEQFQKFGQKQLERWFQKYASERPAFAKKVEEQVKTETQPKQQPQQPVRKPVSTTTRQGRPPNSAPQDGPGMWKGKTVKPGQPNSMSKAELREYMRSQGRRLNY